LIYPFSSRGLKMRSEDLAVRLEEAEATLRAIREAAVDAFVIDEGEGSRVYMLEGADRPYSILIEQMQQGAAVLGADGSISYCNTSLAELLGVPVEKLIGAPLHGYIAADQRAYFQALLRAGRTRKGQGEIRFERGNGTRVPVRVTVSAMERDRGGAVGLTITDLTTERHYAELLAVNQALRASEARLKAEEEHQNFLIGELTHRVKNTLAVVHSMAHHTMRNTGTFAEAVAAFEARLFALSSAHDLLISRSWRGAEIQALVAAVISPFRGGSSKSRISICGEEIWIQPNVAIAFSMILHELATNAVKYGSLSSETGRVEISWEVAQDNQQTFQLRWAEIGGPPVEMPRRKGFGSRLIEQGIAPNTSGDVRLLFAREGLVCTIDAPLDAIRGGTCQDRPPETLSVR
jgi:PAS domain S-box-containing protein